MNQKERDKYQLVPGKGTLAQRLRARAEAIESDKISSTTYSHSPSNVYQPDPARGTVKKSFTDDGPRSLRGTMIHRSPKTLRGRSVVADKEDRST